MLLCVTCGFNSAVAGSVESAGTAIQIMLPVAATLSTMYKRDQQGFGQYLKVFVSTTAITYGLKYSVNETRPSGGRHSFPSGHTSASFAASAFMWRRYGWTYGLPASLAATFVGYSRVEAKRHYWHDVLAGAAIGVGMAYVFGSRQDTSLEVSGSGIALVKRI